MYHTRYIMNEKKDNEAIELDEKNLNDLNGGLDGYPPYMTPPVHNHGMYQQGLQSTFQEKCSKCGYVIRTYKGSLSDEKPKMQVCPSCNQRMTPIRHTQS